MRRLPLCRLAVVATLLVAGCSGPTTPKGDLHTEATSAPASADASKAEAHSADISIGRPPAKLRVTWRTLEHEGVKHLLGYTVTVLETGSGVALSHGGTGRRVNTGTKADPVAELPFLVTASGKSGCGSWSETKQVVVRADGSHAVK